MEYSGLRHPHDAEQLESLRRWLREREDELAIFKRTLDKRDAEIERLHAEQNINDQLLKQVNELTDQVEQLRQCQQADGWTISQQSKEIERLRKSLDDHLDSEADARPEIERLLGMMKEDRPALVRAIADEFAAAKAEIERLRIEDARWQRVNDDLATRCNEQSLEIERLHQRLAERLIDYCVCNNCNSPAEGCNCVACTTKRPEAEIERLQFMLRETLPYFGLQTVAPNLQVPHPLGVRIRKVLGDVPDA